MLEESGFSWIFIHKDLIMEPTCGVPLKVIIDRAKWYRGLGGVTSALVVGPKRSQLTADHGTMCCLGFTALACGFKKDELIDISSPSSLSSHTTIPEGNPFLRLLNPTHDYNKDSVVAMMEINDKEILAGETREIALKAIARELGFEFEFIN